MGSRRVLPRLIALQLHLSIWGFLVRISICSPTPLVLSAPVSLSCFPIVQFLSIESGADCSICRACHYLDFLGFSPNFRGLFTRRASNDSTASQLRQLFVEWCDPMLRAAIRSRSLSSCLHQWKLGFNHNFSSLAVDADDKGLLNLQEIEQVLSDVKADDVKVIPSRDHCDWADFMVLATGRSAWHVKNIAQALIYKAKQKQKGAKRLVLPSVEGQEGGKWIVVDSGRVIIHALDENARTYYNLENLWTTPTNQEDPEQELAKSFVKIRPKNNSKKRVQKSS